jgi:ATP-dependent helicase HrpB
MPYPVLKIVDELRQHLSDGRITIVQAPPGAGKSTVLPIQLMDEKWLGKKKIVMLEPRRLAARSVAMRMASILNSEVGKTVGYRVRFDNKTSTETVIEVVTEGILTRMIQHDSALSNIGMVIFDEFHERSLHADLSLALCLQVQQIIRPDLRIMIMSATLDTEKISARLNNAAVVTSSGKQYPVAIQYIPADQHTPITGHTLTAIKKALQEHAGDLLVFLPGAGEINRVAEALQASGAQAEVYPLYGDLPFKKQQEAILPHPEGRRKIILATSIAETSLTIEGVGIVIDCGYSRVPKFNPRSGFTRLETVRVTKDSADQRAGRAGRLGPGVCYRLWSESIQANLVPQRIPEILEADLAPMMLELFAWGIRSVSELVWMTPPPPGAVNQALDVLKNLKATEGGKITASGRAMVRLPIHPRLAHMMLEASAIDPTSGVALATDLAALLEERDPLSKETGADLTLRIEALRNWRKGERTNADLKVLGRIEKLAESWRNIMHVPVENTRVHDTMVGRLLMAAFPERIAKRTDMQNGRYKLANGRAAKLHANDPLIREPWLAVADLDEGVGEGKIFMATALSEEDLLEQCTSREVVTWDYNRGMVTSNVEKHIGDLVVSVMPMHRVPEELRIAEICRVIREKGLSLLPWTDTHDIWQARVLSLKKWRPHEPWPDVSEEALLNSVQDWLPPFLNGVMKASDFQKLDLTAILNSILPWELATRLDALAPLKLPVPSGSLINVKYFQDSRSPVMEVRLQEVFGLTETPAVNEGQVKIILHLLSPGYKPVQVTQDLKSFWSNTYPEVRKELRMRYPRHSWPEDPWSAEPVRGAKRRAR